MIISSATVQYSPVGAELAKSGMRSYEGANRWDDADRFIGDSLRSIASSDPSSADEKALSSMGVAMGNVSGMKWENSAKARYAVAGTIAAAVPGPLGAVLAQATTKAYGAANRWDDADAIVGRGLVAIRDNPNTSQDEKDVADLGWTMGNHAGMHWTNSAKARNAAAEAIASQAQGQIGTVLANVAHQGFDSADSWVDADNITGDGLRAILSNPRTSQVQKAVATSTLEQTSSGVTYQNSATARAAALSQIAQEGSR